MRRSSPQHSAESRPPGKDRPPQRGGESTSRIAERLGTTVPAITRWRDRYEHPRVHLHFTPTSSSWANLVERFFAEITAKAIRRGVFTHVRELEEAIRKYIALRNEDPRPFVWTAKIATIIKKVAQAWRALAQANNSLGTVR